MAAASGMPEDLKYEQCRLQTFQRAGWSRVYAEQLAAAGLCILESQSDGKSGVHGGVGFHAFMGSRLPDLIAAMMYVCKLFQKFRRNHRWPMLAHMNFSFGASTFDILSFSDVM